MPQLVPMRGEVWDVRFPVIGEHPAVVLSENQLNSRIGHIVVILITGNDGPDGTHVRLDADAGLTRYDESYANVTDLHSISRGRFRAKRGEVNKAELASIVAKLRIYLGL